jgi:hypothetical protein
MSFHCERTQVRLLLLAIGLFLGQQSGRAQLEPFVGCVSVDKASKTVTAYFGYVNPTGTTIMHLPGSQGNFLVPGMLPRAGQPTEFKPGTHHAVFSVTFPADSQLIWNLEGDIAPADVSSPPCPLVDVPEQTFTIGRTGTLTVSDARVSARSLVVVQYVSPAVLAVPASVSITAGQFTVRGMPAAQFRYVLYYY